MVVLFAGILSGSCRPSRRGHEKLEEEVVKVIDELGNTLNKSGEELQEL